MDVRWHPLLNAALALVQFLLSMHHYVFPSEYQQAIDSDLEPTNATAFPDAFATLIDPAPYAFHIWWVIYILTWVHAVVDWVLPQHSIYEDAERPTYLRVCLSVSCLLNVLWTVVNAWLGWNALRSLVMFLLLVALLPIYVFLIKESLDHLTPRSWVRYFSSALAIRMYFAWVCATLVLCVTASFQSLHGGFLSFQAYAVQLSFIVVMALSGVVYGNDPVIGLVAIWTMLGLMLKHGDYSVSTQHDLDLLQGAAAVLIPTLPMMIAIAAVYHHCRNQDISDMPWELAPWSYRSNAWDAAAMKPISELTPLEDYGTENYGTDNDYPPFTFSSQSSVEV